MNGSNESNENIFFYNEFNILSSALFISYIFFALEYNESCKIDSGISYLSFKALFIPYLLLLTPKFDPGPLKYENFAPKGVKRA